MRITGWESRLNDYIKQARGKPFVWGEHGCSPWCAGWIKDCTGKDFLVDWPAYHSEEEASALLASRGFSTCADLADHYLEDQPVALAQRGDIMYHSTGALGICNGRLSYFIGLNGMFAERTLSCLRSWKVR